MKRLVESFEEFTSKKNGAKKLNEGTGNFYNRNASKIYAIGMGYGEENEDGEVSTYGQMDFEDDIEYVQEQLQEVFSKNFREGSLPESVSRSLYSNNFSTTDIGSIYEYIQIGKIEYKFSVYCFATSGYYEGANLDYVGYVENCNEGYEFELGEDDVPVKLQKLIDKTIAKVESVYAKCSMPLVVSARFSNGETIYSKG